MGSCDVRAILIERKHSIGCSWSPGIIPQRPEFAAKLYIMAANDPIQAADEIVVFTPHIGNHPSLLAEGLAART